MERDDENQTQEVDCGLFELKALFRARVTQATICLDTPNASGVDGAKTNLHAADFYLDLIDDLLRAPPPKDEVAF